MFNIDNAGSISVMDVVAFHYASPGACGRTRIIRVVTKDISLYQIDYLDMPKDIVLRACPPLDAIIQSTSNHLPLPVLIQEDRVSPDMIESLDQNDIFVFGSNIFGFHDGGASERACTRFGAIWGQADGIQGQSYAIPTDGVTYRMLMSYVYEFIEYARSHPDKKFLLTRIGCGAAGYNSAQVAPLFPKAVLIPNILLPRDFWKYLL